MKTHEEYMQLALEEARKAAALGEIPIGAVLVHEGGLGPSALSNRRRRAQENEFCGGEAGV